MTNARKSIFRERLSIDQESENNGRVNLNYDIKVFWPGSEIDKT